MKEELAINKKKLGINDWLELIKEDKNLNGGYISISQYIWLLELENKQLKERVDYLERSNNRREDTILEQRQEISNLEDNPIKIIKCGDIEIPVEYLKQTTVNVNGDDYIRLQQENKILRENAEHNDKVVDKVNWENQLLKKENKQLQEELKCTIGIVEHNRIISKKNKEMHQLKDNWNKLKEWVNKHYDYYMNEEDYIGGRLCFTDMKSKMHELEGSDSNVKD